MAAESQLLFSSPAVFQKFAKQYDSVINQLGMTKSDLKWGIIYMYGKRPTDEEIDQLILSIWKRNTDDLIITLNEFENMIKMLSDPFTSNIDFEPYSLYDNYKIMFELLEDYENKNQSKKGFISFDDFKAAVREYSKIFYNYIFNLI